jgi:hypothetical protein
VRLLLAVVAPLWRCRGRWSHPYHWQPVDPVTGRTPDEGYAARVRARWTQETLSARSSLDPPLFHGLNELEQAPAALRPGDRLPFPALTLAETTERVQIVVSWKDDAGPHRESFTVQLP